MFINIYTSSFPMQASLGGDGDGKGMHTCIYVPLSRRLLCLTLILLVANFANTK